ncbi:hypothetical protein KC872_04915 [Candidatus Kaiserbacteria bacterium]|nr:hypothetical protein [Candidatus Kaiserbacteria bacterium]
MQKKIVARITRHPVDADRMACLKAVFGDDVRVVTEDIRYGEDPVGAVKALIEHLQADGDRVVAVEATAPFPVLSRLVNAQRELGVALIRAQFARDEGGRAIVAGKDEGGRDILAFSHYEEIEKIELLTRRLGPPPEEK